MLSVWAEIARPGRFMTIPNAAHRPTVLVIDDDPAVGSSLKFSLELEGFTVCTYPDAASVLASDDAATAECLVVDHKLPGMNGLDLLRELRACGIGTPAILITSAPGAGLVEQAALAGVAIVEKPLFGNALSDGVRNACRGNRAGR